LPFLWAFCNKRVSNGYCILSIHRKRARAANIKDQTPSEARLPASACSVGIELSDSIMVLLPESYSRQFDQW
jgi:hypothetical protein